MSNNTDTYSSQGTINALPLSVWVHSTPTQGRFPIWLLIPELKPTLTHTQLPHDCHKGELMQACDDARCQLQIFVAMGTF